MTTRKAIADRLLRSQIQARERLIAGVGGDVAPQSDHDTLGARSPRVRPDRRHA